MRQYFHTTVLFYLKSGSPWKISTYLVATSCKNSPNQPFATLTFYSAQMCHMTIVIHRCGRHTSREPDYCPDARRRNGRWYMCNNRSSTRTNQRDTVCNDRRCRHRQLGGVWTCCMCENGPNRYGRCVFARLVNLETDHVINPCNHSPCDACTAYVSTSHCR